jgi:chitinase
VDSRWQSGACYTLEVSNPTKKSVATWTGGFTLAPGTTITQSWSGAVTQVGPAVVVKAPTWGGTIPAGGKVRHFGMCISGVGDPTGVRAS